jgi:hypothetical protein
MDDIGYFISGMIIGRLLPLSPYFPQIGAGLLVLSGVWIARPRAAVRHWVVTLLLIAIAVWWNFPLLTGYTQHCIGF